MAPISRLPPIVFRFSLWTLRARSLFLQSLLECLLSTPSKYGHPMCCLSKNLLKSTEHHQQYFHQLTTIHQIRQFIWFWPQEARCKNNSTIITAHFIHCFPLDHLINNECRHEHNYTEIELRQFLKQWFYEIQLIIYLNIICLYYLVIGCEWKYGFRQTGEYFLNYARHDIAIINTVEIFMVFIEELRDQQLLVLDWARFTENALHLEEFWIVVEF